MSTGRSEHKRFATEVLGVSPEDYDAIQEKNGAEIAAKRSPGRPAEMQDGGPRRIYIADADWDRLIALGEGNASKGIRIALDNTP